MKSSEFHGKDVRPAASARTGLRRGAACAGKVALSAVAIVLFSWLGVLVTELAGIAPARADSPADLLAGGTTAPTAGQFVPAPPASKLTFHSGGAGGTHRRYESRLTESGLRDFYLRSLLREGWHQDRTFEDTRVGGQPFRSVLLFRKGASRCMIAVEGKDAPPSVVTVLLFDVAG